MSISWLEYTAQAVISMLIQLSSFNDISGYDTRHTWLLDIPSMNQSPAGSFYKSVIRFSDLYTGERLTFLEVYHSMPRYDSVKPINSRHPELTRAIMIYDLTFESVFNGQGGSLFSRHMENKPFQPFTTAINNTTNRDPVKTIFLFPWKSRESAAVLFPSGGIPRNYTGDATLSAPPVLINASFENGLPLTVRVLNLGTSQSPEGADATVGSAVYYRQESGR